MTEEELATMLSKNKGLSITSITKNKEIDSSQDLIKKFLSKDSTKVNKISLDGEAIHIEQKTKKKYTGIDVKKIITENKNCNSSIVYNESFIGMLFPNTKLLSVNQIFSILQYRKYELFTYKKSWQELVKNSLINKNNLPYFDDLVEITLFRQAPKLVDEDALSVMFKFIIDALKADKKNNYQGILAEDNPKIVSRIILEQEKGENFVGIKIKDISKDNIITKFSPHDIMKF